MPKGKQLIIVCLLASIVIQVGVPEVRATAPGTRVRIEPADLVVGLNETFVVQVVIEEANDLGAFQFDLTYDPSIVQVTEAALGDFLGSRGNSTFPVGPQVDNAEGRVTFGACIYQSATGPSGTGILATITCVAQGEGSTALELREVQVLDTAGDAQQATAEDGQVVVRSAGATTPTITATPVPTVPTASATPVPAPTATATSTPTPTATPSPASTATPVVPVATATPVPTNTPEAVDTSIPPAITLPSLTPIVTSPTVETPTGTPLPSPTPSPMPSVSIAPTETRPTEVTTPPAVTTVEATQTPAAVTTTPTSPPATPPPPSPSPSPMPSPTPMPTSTPLTPLSAPAATGSSRWPVLGLMLAALTAAILAVFILTRRPGG